jgi:hypothetical protein
MTISTIALIALAAFLVFIMVRVGRGAREAAHAQAVVSHASPEDPRRIDPQRGADDIQADHGPAHKRHGCC